MGVRAQNLLLLGISVIVSIVVAETVLRFAQVTRDSYLVLFRADPDFQFHYRADQRLRTIFGRKITIDRFGHRVTHNYEQAKPQNVHRVLILGDSVGFGLNVDDEAMFTRGLAEQLTAIAGRTIEVINASCESYNTFNELAWYKKEGRAFRPDEIWLLFVSNDAATGPSSFYVSEEGYSTSDPNSPLPLFLRFQLRRSALALLGYQALSSMGGAENVAPAADDATKEATMEALSMLLDEGRRDALVRVWYLPRRVEVETGVRASVFEWASTAVGAAGLALTDVTTALQEFVGTGQEAYLAHDPVHLSPAGHQALRDVILTNWQPPAPTN